MEAFVYILSIKEVAYQWSMDVSVPWHIRLICTLGVWVAFVGLVVQWCGRGNVETFHQQLASWAFSFCLYIYKIVAFNCWSSVWSKCHTYFPTISNLFVASISRSTSPLFCYQIISFGAACLLHPAKQRCALLPLVTFWQGILWWNSCDHSKLMSMILIPIWRMKYSVVIHWSSWMLSLFF